MRKGLSHLVSMLLLLLIVLILIVVSFTFFMNVFQTSSNSAGNSAATTNDRIAMKFKIDEIDYINGNIYLRNTGPVPVTGISVFLDNEPINSTTSKNGQPVSAIQPGEVASVAIDPALLSGTQKLKITASGYYILEQNIESDITLDVETQ